MVDGSRQAGAIKDQAIQAALEVLTESGMFECGLESAGKLVVEQMFAAAQGATPGFLEKLRFERQDV